MKRPTGGPKNRGHYVWPLTSHLQNTWTNLHDFWQTSTLLLSWTHLLTLHSSTSYRRVAPPVESPQPGFCFPRLLGLLQFQHKISSRISLTRLLNNIDSSSVSKDGKMEAMAVHGLLEQQETLWVSEILICIKAWLKVSQASVNGDVVSNVFCKRTVDTTNVFKSVMFV